MSYSATPSSSATQHLLSQRLVLTSRLATIVAHFGGVLTSTGITRETCISVASELDTLAKDNLRHLSSISEKEETTLITIECLIKQLRGVINNLSLSSASAVLVELSSALATHSRPSLGPIPHDIISLTLNEFARTKDKTTLKTSTLVNSSWRPTAQQLLFSISTIRASRRRIAPLTKLLDSKPLLGCSICKLRVGASENELALNARVLDVSGQDLAKLLELTPRLATLEMYDIDTTAITSPLLRISPPCRSGVTQQKRRALSPRPSVLSWNILLSLPNVIITWIGSTTPSQATSSLASPASRSTLIL